jgi:hypothetical protein
VSSSINPRYRPHGRTARFTCAHPGGCARTGVKSCGSQVYTETMLHYGRDVERRVVQRVTGRRSRLRRRLRVR